MFVIPPKAELTSLPQGERPRPVAASFHHVLAVWLPGAEHSSITLHGVAMPYGSRSVALPNAERSSRGADAAGRHGAELSVVRLARTPDLDLISSDEVPLVRSAAMHPRPMVPGDDQAVSLQDAVGTVASYAVGSDAMHLTLSGAPNQAEGPTGSAPQRGVFDVAPDHGGEVGEPQTAPPEQALRQLDDSRLPFPEQASTRRIAAVLAVGGRRAAEQRVANVVALPRGLHGAPEVDTPLEVGVERPGASTVRDLPRLQMPSASLAAHTRSLPVDEHVSPAMTPKPGASGLIADLPTLAVEGEQLGESDRLEPMARPWRQAESQANGRTHDPDRGGPDPQRGGWTALDSDHPTGDALRRLFDDAEPEKTWPWRIPRSGLPVERLPQAQARPYGNLAASEPTVAEPRYLVIEPRHFARADREAAVPSVEPKAVTGWGGIGQRPLAVPGEGELRESGELVQLGQGAAVSGEASDGKGREIVAEPAAAGHQRPLDDPSPRPTHPSRGTLPVEPERLMHIVRTVHERAADGVHAVRLQLHPAHLGELQLRVATQNGAVTAHFVTESEAARAAIETALPSLREQLATHGVSVQELAVSLGGHDRPAADQRPSPSLRPRPERSARSANAEPMRTDAHRIAGMPSTIDLLA